MPQYRVYKEPVITELSAEQVAPIIPPPVFRENTSHIRVVQGGFMDDKHLWFKAPKRVKEAIRVNGIWYWAVSIRDRKGRYIVSKHLFVPTMHEF